MPIHKGKPLPPIRTGIGSGVYAALLERLQPGDSIELLPVHSRGLASLAKTKGIKLALRKLSDELVGVWRLA